MKYTVYTEPFTYIVFEELFGDAINIALLSEIQRLNPYMKPGKVAHGNTNSVAGELKSNSNVWLFDFYKQYPNRVNAANMFEKYLWTEAFKNVFKSMSDSLFRSIVYTDNGQLLLSRYDKGDHYNWHRDYNDTLTMNYMISREPLKFTGGSFILGSWDTKEELVKIPFKNNSLVVFPSRVFHKVEAVLTSNGEIEDARFTLQYWSKLKHLADR